MAKNVILLKKNEKADENRKRQAQIKIINVERICSKRRYIMKIVPLMKLHTL